MADTGNWPTDSATFGEEPPSGLRVTGEWQVSLVLSDEWALPVPVRFTYCAEDPYAVRLDFYLTKTNPVSWTFARELLITGALRSSGLGDVRVWPTYDDMICLSLNSGEGEAVLEIPGTPLVEWLERTYQFVPPGREHEHQPLEVDALQRRLLYEASPAAAESEGEAGGGQQAGPPGVAGPYTDAVDDGTTEDENGYGHPF